MRVKSSCGDSRSPWIQEPAVGTSAMSEFVPSGRLLGVAEDAAYRRIAVSGASVAVSAMRSGTGEGGLRRGVRPARSARDQSSAPAGSTKRDGARGSDPPLA